MIRTPVRSVILAGLASLALMGCSDEPEQASGPHPASLREGCQTPPKTHGPEIASIGVRQKVHDLGSAWAVVVLKEVPKLDNGVPDQKAIATLIQRYLTDIDANENEKLFGGKYTAIVNLELSVGRLARTVELPYVCAVTLDHAAWPVS